MRKSIRTHLDFLWSLDMRFLLTLSELLSRADQRNGLSVHDFCEATLCQAPFLVLAIELDPSFTWLIELPAS
jgi:hypothetical protein